MNAPLRGQWERGPDSPMSFCALRGSVRISVRTAFRDDVQKDIERWLVESLEVWPHPNAPIDPDEIDYPAHRNDRYMKLMEMRTAP